MSPGPGQPRTAPSPRPRAPEVTRSWPADPPRRPLLPADIPLVVLSASCLLAALLVVARADDRGGVLVAALLAWACAWALLELASRRGAAPADRALSRAIWEVWGGEPPGRIASRLRRVDLRGRPGLHRDLAVRCLERSAMSHVQERVLREEAGRLLERARDGLRLEGRR